MKVLDMALNELKIMSRNRVTFALLMVLPIFMIFIMGNAMAGVFNTDKGIEKFSVLYVNEDNGTLGKAFDNFINNGAGDFIIPVKGSYDTAEQEVLSGKYTDAIVVPKDLSEKIGNGEKADINVISSGKDTIKDSITRSIVDSFTKYMMTQLAVTKGYSEYVKGADLSQVSQKLSQTQADIGNSFVTTVDAQISDAKKLSSFQYFTLSMLLFFLSTVGMGLGTGIVEDREKKLYSRINSYPVKLSEYLASKILGNMMLSIIQAAVVIVVTKFAFNVDWGTNLLGIGSVIVLMILISSSIGLVFSSLVRTSKAVSAGMTVVLWMVAFIGGGFTPVPALEPAGRLTFYKWGLDSMVNFMGGGSFSSVISNLLMLLTLVAVLWTVGIVLYRRRVYHE